MGNRTLADLVATLRAEDTLWIRLAAHRAEDSWRLALLEITAGGEPRAFRRESWVYQGAAFHAGSKRGTAVADWLERRIISEWRLELELEDLPTSAQVERRDSGFPGSFAPLDWPSVVWSLRLANQYPHQYSDLVADDAPPFLEFDQAAAAFFALPRSLNRSFSGRELVFRVQDRRARIRAVRLRPTEILVSVEGETVAGTTLALGGDWPGASARLDKPGEVRLPIEAGLPPRPWLALHHDHELLDRRYLDASSGQPGVEVEIDVATKLTVLLAGGEGPRVEFKRELPGANPHRAMKTVAAFANGDGGTLVFGVDDAGGVVGLDAASLRKSADRLANLIRDHVHPLVEFDIDVLEEERILLANVQPSPLTPYGVGTDLHEVVYYVRRGANSYPATPADVRVMVRAREPLADPYAHLRLR